MPQGFSLAHFDAVLFDVDGTLVDSLEMIIPGLCDTIEKYGTSRPSEEEMKSIIGLPMKVQFTRYLTHSPTDDQLREMSDYALDRFEAYVDREKLFQPAIDTMRLCKAHGLGTALVTSKSAKELAGFMARFPGADAVDETVCADEVPLPKPAPDSALLAMKKLAVQPSKAVFIGDSIFDMRCAHAAGIASIAVAYGAAQREVLEAEHPSLLIESPEELLALAHESFLNQHATKESNNRRTDAPDNRNRAAGAA